MVNVGGRSKGCSTCRRRRVKCDETRPICKRCQKLGLECEGPKGTAFIEAPIVKSRRSGTGWTENKPPSPSFAVQPTVIQAVLLPRFKELEVSICYARKHLYPNGPIDLGLQALRFSDIEALSQKDEQTLSIPVFHRAALSFAAVYFGNSHHQNQLVQDGYAMHGTALVQLNYALSDSNCYVHDEIILSVITLAILECLVPSGPRHYLQHMLGLQQLFELRGPQSLVNSSKPTENMYKGCRFMILHGSLRMRQPSMLAQADWKTAFRAKCSHNELPEQDLYSIIADCTVLLTEQDKWVSDLDMNAKTAFWQQNALKHRALALLAEVRAWKAAWDADEENMYFDSFHGMESLLDRESENEFPASFFPTMQFANNSSVRLLMLYNIALIHILQILASLSPPSPFTTPQTPLPLDSHVLQDELWAYIEVGQYSPAEHLAALEIGRALPAGVGHHQRHLSPPFLSPLVQWGAATAWRTFGGNESVEGRWMMKLIKGEHAEAFAAGVWEL